MYSLLNIKTKGNKRVRGKGSPTGNRISATSRFQNLKYSSFFKSRLVGRIMHACAFLNQSLYRYVVKNNVIGPSAIPYHILTAT